MHLNRKAQIAILIADKSPIIVQMEYSDFADVLSKESAAVLPEHIEINLHVIDLKEANGFIQPFKSFAGAPILFNKKSNGNF